MGQCGNRVISFDNKERMVKSLQNKGFTGSEVFNFEYIETFYNSRRPHSHCKMLSPNEFEKKYSA